MTTLSNVITEIKDKGLEYIYIDEMGESGSIEYNHDIINRSTIENTFEVPLFDLNAYGKMCVVYIIKAILLLVTYVDIKISTIVIVIKITIHMYIYRM